MTCQVLVVIVLFCAICLSSGYLKQKVDRVERQIASIRSSVHQCDREIEHLRNRSETHKSWSYISRKIAEFNLQLRPAKPGQVRNMALLSPHTAQLRADRVLAYRR